MTVILIIYSEDITIIQNVTFEDNLMKKIIGIKDRVFRDFDVNVKLNIIIKDYTYQCDLGKI